ncbi:hypothetical protein [uncultured Microbacterium sp.]|uniref:hypothetical protein n=1 Tax=uncultured Microbacterium sp. TaxID=191216 RepID=UPI0025DBC748|nr:hypothetical protein [uncultured Microbacterium sp.]
MTIFHAYPNDPTADYYSLTSVREPVEDKIRAFKNWDKLDEDVKQLQISKWQTSESDEKQVAASIELVQTQTALITALKLRVNRTSDAREETVRLVLSGAFDQGKVDKVRKAAGIAWGTLAGWLKDAEGIDAATKKYVAEEADKVREKNNVDKAAVA